ncbi:MAG: hypothetical protein KF711_11425 [Nitrospira sp.]|nr:hypothetical protein [Nitrospira sp.]
MIKDAINKLAERADLTEQEAETVMGEIMDGSATCAQIAVPHGPAHEGRDGGRDRRLGPGHARQGDANPGQGFVGAGYLRHRRRSGPYLQHFDDGGLRGGGSRTHGRQHGNRSVSSKSGSADVLAALGVAIQLPPEQVADCVNEVGIGFLFAPLYHSAMKHCAQPRQELGIRTLLNILGPLLQSGRSPPPGRRGVRCRPDRVAGQGAGSSRRATLFCGARDGRPGRNHRDGSHQNFRGQGRRGVELHDRSRRVRTRARQAEGSRRGKRRRQRRHHAGHFQGPQRPEARYRLPQRGVRTRGRAQGEDVTRRVRAGSADDRRRGGHGKAGTTDRIYQEGLVTP